MRWSHDEGEWLDEEVDDPDIMEENRFFESVLSHASIVFIPKGADIFQSKDISGEVPARKDGDIRCPISIIAQFLGEEEGCASDTDEQ